MQIILVTKENKIPLTIEPSVTIHAFKQSLPDVTTKSAHQILLSLSGLPLEDSKTFKDYNIQAGSILHLTEKAPPKDLFNFDQCSSCQSQAVDPCALPCGHSCCKPCIPAEATSCPILGCEHSFSGQSRDSLPTNWIATLFSAEANAPNKSEKQIICQVCFEESGIQRPATHWCESCSAAGSPDYFCSDCIVSQHSIYVTRNHSRFPINERKFPFSKCKKHNESEDWICIDEGKFICPSCKAEDHRKHKTMFAVKYAESMKQDLQAVVEQFGLGFETRKNNLKKSKLQTQNEIQQLEERIKLLEGNMILIESEINEVDEKHEKAKTAEIILKKLIQDLNINDFLDKEKLQNLHARLNLIEQSVVPTPKRMDQPEGCQSLVDIYQNDPEAAEKLGVLFDPKGTLLKPHQLTSLQDLDCSNCNLSDDALSYLQHLTQLTSLDLCHDADSPQISDRGLQYLIPLTQLTSLDICYCDKVTDKGLLALTSLKKLLYIDTCGCDKLTTGAKQQFKRAVPGCRI